jgi:DNA-binding FadR family transcriptional regulator
MTAMSPSGRESGSLVQRAMDAVSTHIRAQGLRVGDTLPGEGFFAASLGVSRPVMREAFGALAALRLIDVANGRRARVGAINGSVMAASLDHAVSTAQITVPEVWDVRRTIELRTAELAASARSDEEADRIVALAEAMAADADDFEATTRHDIAFHKAIAAASHNILFVQIVASFEPLMEVAVPAAWRTRVAEQRRQMMIDRHRNIARAIAERAPEAAVAAMSAHFDTAIGDLLQGDARP